MGSNDTLVERLVAAAEWLNCAMLALTTHPEYSSNTDEALIATGVVATLQEDRSDIYSTVTELLKRRVNAGFYETLTRGGNVQDNKAPSDVPE